MILDCPACGARYRLPDDAIPPDGKAVRCARCKHSWVELGQPLDDAPEGSAAEALAAVVHPDLVPLGSPGIEPGIEVPAVAFAAPPPTTPAMPAAAAIGIADSPPVSAWEPDLPVQRRRRRLWLSPLLLLIALALGAAAILTRVIALPAELASQLDLPTLALPVAELPQLDLTRIPYAGPWLDHRLHPPTLPPIALTLQANADFHQLDNGSRMLVLTGSVANPTGRQQPVPEIEALVLDAARRPVYRWRIPAPLVALPARSSAPFDSSASGYPAEGASVTLRFVRES